MGQHKNIGFDRFPKQGSYLGKRVRVCFDYETDNPDDHNLVEGKVVRDDAEDPFKTIIQLYDGRLVLATECQYSLKTE